jgi:phosphoenolpyruvate-protein phosphotransferase (PTS system enzyme I)
VLARTSLPECRRLAKVALDAPTALAARNAVRASLTVLEELGL